MRLAPRPLLVLSLGLLTAACSDSVTRGDDLSGRAEEVTAPPSLRPSGDGGVAATTMSAPSQEVCGNGLDEDGDGRVDNGCGCAAGATQKCFVGSPSLAGVGACAMGTQTCVTVTSASEVKATEWGPCGGSRGPTAETCNGTDDDCNGKVDDGLAAGSCGPKPNPGPAPDPAIACTGTGLIWQSVGDKCIDDGGQSDEDDDLQIYCVNNIARYCLSKEACPWRSGQPTSDAVTCSRAGLAGTYLASPRQACGVFQGHNRFCCSAAGQISFSGC